LATVASFGSTARFRNSTSSIRKGIALAESNATRQLESVATPARKIGAVAQPMLPEMPCTENA